MKSRRKAREAALQAMYQCDAQSDFSEQLIYLFMDNYYPGSSDGSTVFRAQNTRETSNNTDGAEHGEFAIDLILGTIRNIEEIDKIIEKSCEHWTVPRMARVDRNILRVATYELRYLSNIPPNVTINEAVELAKMFGSDESPMFINGVLDKVLKTTIKDNQSIQKVENS